MLRDTSIMMTILLSYSKFSLIKNRSVLFILISLVSLFMIFATSQVKAQGLFSVPTADTLPTKTWSFDLELDSGSRLNSSETLPLTTMRLAATDFLTIGFDAKLKRSVVISPNISLRLTPQKAPLSFAIGYENVGVRSFGEQPYAVLSQRIQDGRVHAGWTKDKAGNYLMLGFEHPISKTINFQIDYITGKDNFLTTGVQISIPDQWSITLGYILPNSSHTEKGIFLDLGRITQF